MGPRQGRGEPPQARCIVRGTQAAFLDSARVVARDLEHSRTEPRFYCFGRVADGVLTVRFTYRGNSIRIIGAGYWRKGKKLYEAHSKVHK